MRFTVIEAVLVLAGLASFGVGANYALQRWRRRGWKSAEGEVLYSDIRPVEGAKRKTYKGVCILSFEGLGGTRYVGQFHFATGSDYTEMSRTAGRYRTGSRQSILFDATRPEIVQLQSRNTSDLRLAAACGLLGCVCVAVAFTLLQRT